MEVEVTPNSGNLNSHKIFNWFRGKPRGQPGLVLSKNDVTLTHNTQKSVLSILTLKTTRFLVGVDCRGNPNQFYPGSYDVANRLANQQYQSINCAIVMGKKLNPMKTLELIRYHPGPAKATEKA